MLRGRSVGEAPQDLFHVRSGEDLDEVVREARVGLLVEVESVEQQVKQAPQERVRPGHESGGPCAIKLVLAAAVLMHPGREQAVGKGLRDHVREVVVRLARQQVLVDLRLEVPQVLRGDALPERLLDDVPDEQRERRHPLSEFFGGCRGDRLDGEEVPQHGGRSDCFGGLGGQRAGCVDCGEPHGRADPLAVAVPADLVVVAEYQVVDPRPVPLELAAFVGGGRGTVAVLFDRAQRCVQVLYLDATEEALPGTDVVVRRSEIHDAPGLVQHAHALPLRLDELRERSTVGVLRGPACRADPVDLPQVGPEGVIRWHASRLSLRPMRLACAT